MITMTAEERREIENYLNKEIICYEGGFKNNGVLKHTMIPRYIVDDVWVWTTHRIYGDFRDGKCSFDLVLRWIENSKKAQNTQLEKIYMKNKWRKENGI